jgi:hypothetical protein
MGSRTFDFLTESLLFDSRLIAEDFRFIPTDELERELLSYREFCIRETTSLVSEIDSRTSSLVLFSDASRVDTPSLLQAALYSHQYILEDPIIHFSEIHSENSKALWQASGCPPKTGLDKADLARILKNMKELTPLVAASFLKFLPTSIPFEQPEQIPILHSKNYFEDALPAQILQLFKETSHVVSVRPNPDGYLEFDSLRPSRGISIHFKGAPHSYMYWLHDIHDPQLGPKNEDGQHMNIKLALPKEPPPMAHFKVWVQQSVNQSARNLFTETYNKARIASSLNAAYSTRSELLFKALRKAVKPNSTVPLHSANAFLNLDLPFIDQISVQQLMRIRQEEGEAFENFRFAFDQKLIGLREEENPESVKSRAEAALQELTHVQIKELNNKMKGIKEKLGIQAGIATFQLAAAVQTAGWSLLTAAAAAASAVGVVADYREIKRHPAYFLWKVLPKSSRRRSG